jgi:dihydrofolate synthase / folylpolyglutamate synthase
MPSPSPDSLETRYAETLRFLYSLERFGILLGLENITRLLDQLGNPQKSFRCVHVAGSNGKGSTSAFVFNMLRQAGLNSALYTSPHLNDFRERVRINGELVSPEALVKATEKIKALYDPKRTTFFEFTTAAAFLCIAETRPDLAVVEVGLGGRLDATNTVDPVMTVITDISREHEDYLGEGIAAVAGEKAGIIKPGVPLITGASRSAAREVILRVADSAGAKVREFGRDFRGVRTGPDRFTYRSESGTIEDLVLSMPGGHQIKNATIAVAVAEELRGLGYPLTDDVIRKGLRQTRFPGRFELLRRSPDVIIDGAHTPEGMRLLKSTFRKVYPGVRPFMLLGMLRDKNYRDLVKIIAPLAREIVCVPPQGDRALGPDELATVIKGLGVPATSAPDILDGFRLLMEKAAQEDVILAAGSLYMIGPVRRGCGLPDE